MIPIIIAAVVVAAVGAGVTIAALNWDDITEALKGKKLAVLGARIDRAPVGKTSLIRFLSEGSVPEEYKATNRPENVPGRRFQLDELELVIEDMVDVPGSKGRYVSWKQITEDADIVLYLLRIDKFMAGDKDTEVRIREDMGQIKRWLQNNPKNFPLFIIGTHGDLIDPDITTLSSDQVEDFEDRVREMPIYQTIEQLGGGGGKVRLVCGSLKSETTAEALVYRVFKEVETIEGTK